MIGGSPSNVAAVLGLITLLVGNLIPALVLAPVASAIVERAG